MDGAALKAIFSAAAGVWTIAAMVAVALFRSWPLIMDRLNERRRDAHAEEKDGWGRLIGEIARLDERCDGLQHEVDECREREGEWMKRAISAEAALLGEGEARQYAQRIVSTERQIDAEKGK